MAILDIFRKFAGPKASHGDHVDETQKADLAMNTTSIETGKEGVSGQDDWVKVPEETLPAQDAQQGIQKIEAVTLTWGRKSLIALLVKWVAIDLGLEILAD